MKTLKIFFTLLILSLAIISTIAQETPPPSKFDGNDTPINRNQFIAKELQLTKEQKTQWRQINQQGRRQNREARKRLVLAKDELDQLLYSDSVDEVQLNNKLRSLNEAQAEVYKIRAMTELSIRNILTPNQLVKFRDIRNQFKERQKERQRLRRQRRLNKNRRNLNRQNRRSRRGSNRRPI